MMEKDLLKKNIHLHFIVIILGFTAVLGKLISVGAVELVWFRTLIASLALFVYLKFSRIQTDLPGKKILMLLGIGLIVGIHWLSFFQAIKVSNVSVTLGCLSVTTLFTSFLEPLISRRKISVLEVILGVVIIFGIYLIFHFETRYFLGIVFTIAAAFMASLFSVLNKVIAVNYDVRVISFYELTGAFMILSIFMAGGASGNDFRFLVSSPDWLWLLLLGIVCTSYAFTATIGVMKKLSAFHVVLAINLEPIYGILMAYLIFGSSENMSSGFYSGALIILASVFVYPLLRNRLAEFRSRQGIFSPALYRVSGLFLRAMALLIDLCIFCLFFFPVAFLLKGVWLMGPGDHLWVIFDPVCAVYLFVMICYYVFLEAYLGGTIGKIILGIRIVNEDGKVPGLKASLIRNLGRMIDGILIHLVGMIIALSNKKRQRFGDKWARTYVIRTVKEKEKKINTSTT